MADGTQQDFGFRELPRSRLRPGEIVVDLFAGGGGASVALEQALGRPVDIAINHNPIALAMHAANHPVTRHLAEDVWHADPTRLCADRTIGWLHASPDCTHFSQAKGGQPRSRATRSLSWVVVRWAGTVRPRIISLENVKQILQWGPLVAKRCKTTGRVVRVDGSVAERGERVPVAQQWLVPDKRHAGRTWRRFAAILRDMGYAFEWRQIKACDYGAGTSRERLFAVARRDGEPIAWPSPTHGPVKHSIKNRNISRNISATDLLPYVTAADCIDWSIPCPSIFERKRPLADATCRRIARGIQRYVIDAGEPFIVPATHPTDARVHSVGEPLRTITAANRGELMVCAPTLVQRYGEHSGQAPRAIDIETPMPTIVPTGNGATAVTAFVEQANGGGPNGNPAPARAADRPVSSITGTGSQQRLITAHLTAMAQNVPGVDPEQPLPTILAGATRYGTVEAEVATPPLSPEHEAGAQRVAAFLIKYHGVGQNTPSLADPMSTISTKDRLALVTVTIQGQPYVIVDIGLRMLKPRELYRAQGFPHSYIIDRTADGRALTISQSVAMVGNSVSPPPLRAIAEANLDCAAALRTAA